MPANQPKAAAPLARLADGQMVPPRPHSTMGFPGRSEMLELWGKLDAAQQNGLLIAARGMARRNADDNGPVIRTGKR